eukprot:3839674-Amphidinium_carterae.1
MCKCSGVTRPSKGSCSRGQGSHPDRFAREERACGHVARCHLTPDKEENGVYAGLVCHIIFDTEETFLAGLGVSFGGPGKGVELRALQRLLTRLERKGMQQQDGPTEAVLATAATPAVPAAVQD